MTGRLLISTLPGETRAALIRDGRLQELVIQRDDRPERLGSLYLGRVAAIDRGLAAAFVELGLERPGLLPLSEAPGGLTEGASLPLRVVREARDDEEKGLRLTARLLAPPADLEALLAGRKAPCLLQAGDDPLTLLLAEGDPPDEILVEEPLLREPGADGPDLLTTLRQRLERLAPDLAGGLKPWREPEPLFEAEGLEAEIEALLLPSVALTGGAGLLIEPVRTLTAIDVNSGAFQSGGGPEALNLAVNRLAIPEIARQIRLRQLSGLLVIDFLPLKNPERRKALAGELRQAMNGDPEPHKVFGLQPSGLAEVTRRRGRRPLQEILTEPCGLGGSGRVLGPATLAFGTLRSLIARSGAGACRRAILAAPPTVLAALGDEGPAGAARRALERRLGFAVTLEERPEGSPPENLVS